MHVGSLQCAVRCCAHQRVLAEPLVQQRILHYLVHEALGARRACIKLAAAMMLQAQPSMIRHGWETLGTQAATQRSSTNSSCTAHQHAGAVWQQGPGTEGLGAPRLDARPQPLHRHEPLPLCGGTGLRESRGPRHPCRAPHRTPTLQPLHAVTHMASKRQLAPADPPASTRETSAMGTPNTAHSRRVMASNWSGPCSLSSTPRERSSARRSSSLGGRGAPW